MIIYAPRHDYIDINSDHRYDEEDIDYENLFQTRERAQAVCDAENANIVDAQVTALWQAEVNKVNRHNEGVKEHNYLVQGGFRTKLQTVVPRPVKEDFTYELSVSSYSGKWVVAELEVQP